MDAAGLVAAIGLAVLAIGEAPAGWTRFPRLWCQGCGRWKPLKNLVKGHRRDDGEPIGKIGFSASGGYRKIANGVDQEYSISECLDSGTSPHPLFDETVQILAQHVSRLFCALFDRKRILPGMLTGELARILDERFRVVVEVQDLMAAKGELALQKENMREARDEARIQAESSKQKAEALKDERDRCFRVIDELKDRLLRALDNMLRHQAEAERLKARVQELEAEARRQRSRPGHVPPVSAPKPESSRGSRRPTVSPRAPSWLASLERKADSNPAHTRKVMLEQAKAERRYEAVFREQDEKERRDMTLLKKQPVVGGEPRK